MRAAWKAVAKVVVRADCSVVVWDESWVVLRVSQMVYQRAGDLAVYWVESWVVLKVV